ncbi:PolC-type DNA polymerase III [Bifidobacterium sp. wkB344]|uniref:3'-5' exonuclease n=1 Tax=Bifidobacterium sp. wkB344 TaxID=2025113 RepID=UPI00217D5EBD|nr:3'-5' exonuclease [Bifidobacterium sp. wkB344]
MRKRKNDKGTLLGIVILALLGVIIMHPVISGIIIAVIVLLAVLYAMAHKQQTQDLGNEHISPTAKKRHGPRGKHAKRPADELVHLNDNTKPADNDDGLPADYVVLDTETTGLRAQMDQIIEIGAVKVRGRSIVDSFDTLVDPGRSLDSRIVELTGITDAMLEGQPKIGDVLPLFWSWVGDDPVVGHNLRFDMRFFEAESARVGYTMPGPVCMDTLQMSRALFPQEKHHRLQDLIRRFGIAENEEHRALSDAAQTKECFEWMRRYMSGLGGGFTTVLNASTSSASASTALKQPRQSRRFKGRGVHRPCNQRPDGQCIVEGIDKWQTVGVSGAAKHQDLFNRFSTSDEVWVRLLHGFIKTGKYKGWPTIQVWLDGEYAGCLTVLQTSRHYRQVPPEGGVSYAHFGARTKRGTCQLRVSFPYAHAEMELSQFAQTASLKEVDMTGSAQMKFEM